MLIKNLSWFQYLMDFTAFGNASVNHQLQTLHEDIIILGAYDDSNQAKGLLVFTDAKAITVLHLKAAEDAYDIRLELLKACTLYAQSKNKQVHMVCRRCGEETSFSNDDLMLPLGFSNVDQYYYFISVLDDQTKAFLTQYYERLQPTILRWQKKGFYLKSFEDLTKEQLLYIQKDPEGVFDDRLLFDDALASTEFEHAPTLSFAVLQNEKVCAYTIFGKRAGKICKYQIRQASRHYKSLGLSSYCTEASVMQAIKEGYQEIHGVVYSNNLQGLPLFTKQLQGAITSVIEYRFFEFS